MSSKVLAPNARFLLEVGCTIVASGRHFYRIGTSDKYRMLAFDQDGRLDNMKEETFDNVDHCMMNLLEYLPDEAPREDDDD